VSVGDVVRIPAGVPQRITNTTDGDLVFFAVCTPRFVPSAYRSDRVKSAMNSEPGARSG
jgi:mannose-6-phosphate isomerase-like protein (cupin superfamily)